MKKKSVLKETSKLLSVFIFLFFSSLIIISCRKNNEQTESKESNNMTMSDENPEISYQTYAPPHDSNNPYEVVEQMPQFPGGDKALIKYLGDNIVYPIEALESGIQGRVIIRFVVTKVGKIERVEVIRSVDVLLDKEAVRVVKSLPRWIPGKHKGENVNVWFTLPVNFKMQ